jgi:endoplasmic reticulum-Golgi intermediate compartment protein 2
VSAIICVLPYSLSLHRTFLLFSSIVGVVGGVWCCAGWAFRISSKAYDVVSGADKTPGLVAAESSGAQAKRKWGGGELRSRISATRQGSSWMSENGSPYSSYAGTPVGGSFGAPSPYAPTTPSVYSPAPASATPYGNGPTTGNGYGLGLGGSGSQSFASQQQPVLSGMTGSSPNLGTGALPTPNPYAAGATSPYSPLGPATPSVFGPASPAAPPPPRREWSSEKKKD